MARVTKKDGIRTKATRDPLIAPTTTPTSKPATMPAAKPKWAIAMAVVIEASPAMDPTDRSISAQPMTKVIPTAMIVTIAVWRRMLSRFVVLKKPWSPSMTAKITNTTTKPT